MCGPSLLHSGAEHLYEESEMKQIDVERISYHKARYAWSSIIPRGYLSRPLCVSLVVGQLRGGSSTEEGEEDRSNTSATLECGVIEPAEGRLKNGPRPITLRVGLHSRIIRSGSLHLAACRA